MDEALRPPKGGCAFCNSISVDFRVTGSAASARGSSRRADRRLKKLRKNGALALALGHLERARPPVRSRSRSAPGSRLQRVVVRNAHVFFLAVRRGAVPPNTAMRPRNARSSAVRPEELETSKRSQPARRWAHHFEIGNRLIQTHMKMQQRNAAPIENTNTFLAHSSIVRT